MEMKEWSRPLSILNLLEYQPIAKKIIFRPFSKIGKFNQSNYEERKKHGKSIKNQ